MSSLFDPDGGSPGGPSRAYGALLVAALVLAGAALAGCPDSGPAPGESWPSGLRLDRVSPPTVLAESHLVAHGEGLVGSILGTTRLRLQGTYRAPGGAEQAVDVAFLAEVIDPGQAVAPLAGGGFQRLCPGGAGQFDGQAVLEVASIATGLIHATAPVGANLACETSLTPSLTGVDGGGRTLNEEIGVEAEGLLIGPGEGESALVVWGCFLPEGRPAPCEVNGEPVNAQRIPLDGVDPEARTGGSFLLSPGLVGLHPGNLEARAQVVNSHAGGIETSSAERIWVVTVQPSYLHSVEPEGASLGGYVDFMGAGFVGGAGDESTELLLAGSFTPDDGGEARALDLVLVAAFDRGDRVRYVLDEHDSLGLMVDLRAESGTVQGTLTPRFAKGADSVTGDPVQGDFRIQGIKQVVYVSFTQGFSDALELFGLRAAHELVRERIMAKARWIYRGINVELQTLPPEDYLLYTQVDITGIDPNGLGLMGYDNSPGKDVGNQRLYDRIGGVNALTQEDGYPGYGGVFVESFLSFSTHPPDSVSPHPGVSPLFDQIFDPVRPGFGDPVTAEELAGLTPRTSGEGCPAPASNRQEVIRCAVFVLGNLLGGTMAHELGHSLGLADPGGDRFHNSGEEPNRLMDAGGGRPFSERAELEGGGPEVFCQQNYEYLVDILPTGDPDPVGGRPSCY